uniref:Butyrophilin subfamily 1 member A1 n=1 Tax=Nothoprocta perdicaria TaxID=30464 RepID=A0A8C6ZS58_NOTPE
QLNPSFNCCCSPPCNPPSATPPLQPLLQPPPATVDQDIVLPCQLFPSSNAQSMTVRWIRYHVSQTVHLYRDGGDLYFEQMEEYQGRTQLSHDGLIRGSLDLLLANVRPSDDGTYVCTVQSDAGYAEAVVELEVSAVGSSPLVSLEGYQDGGIRVLCRSAGWFPQPEALWEAPGGQRLPSTSHHLSRDERGLFGVEDGVTASAEAGGSLSCVVRNRRAGQEKESSLRIAAPFYHDAQPWKVALAVTLVMLLILILGLSVFSVRLFKENGKTWEKQRRDLRMNLCPITLLVPAEEVLLDPDTHHPQLVLSPDCRSVRWSETQQDLPYNRKRFKNLCCVLGREGFTDGRHCWEVEGEVGDETRWAVGVAAETVWRMTIISPNPSAWIWAVQNQKGRIQALTEFGASVSSCPVPRRIWVILDFTGSRVTFVNADNGAEIFAFMLTSLTVQKMYPWFWVEKGEVRLCSENVALPTSPAHPTSNPASEASRPSAETPLLDAKGEEALGSSAPTQQTTSA